MGELRSGIRAKLFISYRIHPGLGDNTPILGVRAVAYINNLIVCNKGGNPVPPWRRGEKLKLTSPPSSIKGGQVSRPSIGGVLYSPPIERRVAPLCVKNLLQIFHTLYTEGTRVHWGTLIIKRECTRVPSVYIWGLQDFYSLTLYVRL